MICDKCKKAVNVRTSYLLNGKCVYVCDACYDELEAARIAEICDSVNDASDFAGVSKHDLSEGFWTHLGIYAKKPNKKSFLILRRAWLWAVHDDHGLANSFTHALDWCGVDVFSMPENLPEEQES